MRKIILAVILFLVGLPGLLDDLEVWSQDWMNGAQWWNWVLMVSGTLLLVHTIVTWRERQPILESLGSLKSAVGTYLSMRKWSAEWEVKASDQDLFRLYEVACLLERSPPVWPITSDEIESQYEELVSYTAKILRPTAFGEWEGSIHEFEIDRRRIRRYTKAKLSYNYRLPWYLKERHDRMVPPGLDERDIRSQLESD